MTVARLSMVCLVLLCVWGDCQAQLAVGRGALLGPDWPHWRGPERTGVTQHASGWDEGAWPLGEPAWTRPVGMGGTSPLAVEGRVYVMGWENGADSVWCLDAATGEAVWRQSYPCPQYGRHHLGDEGYYGGPSASPEYDRQTGYLYTLSIDGDLNCWDTAAGGRRIWGLNLHDAHAVTRRPDAGGGQRDYGYTTAPLVHGGWVLVQAGGQDGTLAAYDKLSGRLVLTSQCQDPAGQAGGLVPMTVEGVPCVGMLTLSRFVVVRLDPGHEGQTVASYPWQSYYANNIPTPAVAGDSVILSSAYNINRTERVRITLRGAEKVWELVGRVTGVCSPVVDGDFIYWAWHRVVCVDLESGRVRWEGGQFGADASCLVTGDGRLLVFASRRLLLVEGATRSPDAYRELAQVPGPRGRFSWPHVVLAEGRILAKDLDGNVMCWELARG